MDTAAAATTGQTRWWTTMDIERNVNVKYILAIDASQDLHCQGLPSQDV